MSKKQKHANTLAAKAGVVKKTPQTETKPAENKDEGTVLAETKLEDKETEKKTASSKFPMPQAPSAYETHVLCQKCVYLSPISHAVFKDAHDIENMKEVWKNNETQEVLELVYPINQMKPEEGNDLNAARQYTAFLEIQKQHKDAKFTPQLGPNMQYLTMEEIKEANKSVASYTEQKQETNKQQKPVNKKNAAKTIIPEIVEEEPETNVIKPTIPLNRSHQDRIDNNHSVDLMNALLDRRKEIKDENPELYTATGKQADLMMWRLLQQWNNQFKGEVEELGFTVNEEMFNYLNSTVSAFLGIKALPCTKSKGQLTIDFNKAIEATPVETQKAIKQDAAVMVEQAKKSSVTIPSPENCTTEDDKLNAIRTISMIRVPGKGNIGKNFQNIIEFARSAFGFNKEDEPAQIVATVLTKLQEKNQSLMLFECIGNAVFGNLDSNLTSVAAHCWLKSYLPDYSDKQIADINKVFLAKKIIASTDKIKKEPSEALAMYSEVLNGFNDELINRSLKAVEKGEDESSLIYDAIVDPVFAGKHICAAKTIKSVKTAYGASLSGKLLKDKISAIAELYHNTLLNPIQFYTEKSAYAVQK